MSDLITRGALSLLLDVLLLGGVQAGQQGSGEMEVMPGKAMVWHSEWMPDVQEEICLTIQSPGVLKMTHGPKWG